MITATADVKTPNASRYLQQLCKHWSHKFETSFDERSGVIRFDTDRSATFAASEDQLRMEVVAADGEILQRMQTVVSDHLQRFAFREQLAIDWSSAA